jgi:hypothetical protein
VLAADVQQNSPTAGWRQQQRAWGEHPGRKEIVMSPIRHIRRIAGVLAGLAGALVALGATPAFATLAPGPGAPADTPVPPVQVHTVVAGGMPGWQITLIAIGAAVLAATVAVLLDRARTTHRDAITTVA